MRHLTLLVFAAINAAFAAEPPQTIPLYPDRTTWSTRDDVVGCRMESPLGYYAVLEQAKIPVEMHIYNSGGHGFGMKQTGTGHYNLTTGSKSGDLPSNEIMLAI